MRWAVYVAHREDREMHSGLMWERIKDKEQLNKFGHRWECNIKMSFTKLDGKAWTEFLSPRKVTSGGNLWTITCSRFVY